MPDDDQRVPAEETLVESDDEACDPVDLEACDEKQVDFSIRTQLETLRKKMSLLQAEIKQAYESDFFKNEEDMLLDGLNIPSTQHANMKANLTLAFRHVEDARMRIGKTLQARQGGISILDKIEMPDGLTGRL